REATLSCGSLVSRLRISSAMPSLKYSFSASPLMLTNGRTAIVRRSFAVAASGTPGGGAGSATTDALAGVGSPGSASTGIAIVRSAPRGPKSNIQPMITAIGKPSTTRAITKVTVQAGKLRPGSIVEATSITTQPAIA